MLPAPLFLFGACAPQFFDEDKKEYFGWGSTVSDATPDFIRDRVEAALFRRSKKSRMCAIFWERILSWGRVSPERVVRRLNNGGGESVFAWEALKRKNPELATQSAEAIGFSKVAL